MLLSLSILTFPFSTNVFTSRGESCIDLQNPTVFLSLNKAIHACRDPKYSGAERTCMWELVLLAEHVHPSVAAMTKALLAGVPIDYAGDPIRDMSTSAFLDKFIQKKPKVQNLMKCALAFRLQVIALHFKQCAVRRESY